MPLPPAVLCWSCAGVALVLLACAGPHQVNSHAKSMLGSNVWFLEVGLAKLVMLRQAKSVCYASLVVSEPYKTVRAEEAGGEASTTLQADGCSHEPRQGQGQRKHTPWEPARCHAAKPCNRWQFRGNWFQGHMEKNIARNSITQWARQILCTVTDERRILWTRAE